LIILLIGFGIWGIFQTLNIGIGAWGNNNQVNWGIAITNFVWWIGIGHSGTLISAILLIFNQSWRKSISRIAELMTIFSLICAAFFPLIHMGRPMLVNWFIPFTGRLGGLGINFYSPLIWDFFAIGTYFIVSVIFLYLGLVPDLYLQCNAGLNSFKNRLFRRLSLNWNGSNRQWQIHHFTTLLVAGLVTALVISVHSIVSLDFAVTMVKGWHNTLFPPYFVLGAIFSGLAIIQIILFFLSSNNKIKEIYTSELRSKINRLIRICSACLAIFYFLEIYHIYKTGYEVDIKILTYKIFHQNSSLVFKAMLLLNILFPVLLWHKKIEKNRLISLLIAIAICIGMWLERYWIIIKTLEVNSVSQNIIRFSPTLVDLSLFAGSVGLFILMYRLIKKYIPLIPEYEKM
jgi:molybdopterin-containing oxidoreductase family membrane subunit